MIFLDKLILFSDNQNLSVTCLMDKWNKEKVFCPDRSTCILIYFYMIVFFIIWGYDDSLNEFT